MWFKMKIYLYLQSDPFWIAVYQLGGTKITKTLRINERIQHISIYYKRVHNFSGIL